MINNISKFASLFYYNNVGSMEKIYSNYQEQTEFNKVCPKTINFLLSYSQALFEFEYEDLSFETFLN